MGNNMKQHIHPYGTLGFLPVEHTETGCTEGTTEYFDLSTLAPSELEHSKIVGAVVKISSLSNDTRDFVRADGVYCSSYGLNVTVYNSGFAFIVQGNPTYPHHLEIYSNNNGAHTAKYQIIALLTA